MGIWRLPTILLLSVSAASAFSTSCSRLRPGASVCHPASASPPRQWRRHLPSDRSRKVKCAFDRQLRLHNTLAKGSGEKEEKTVATIAAVVGFFAINQVFQTTFRRMKVSFPAPLSACGLLFATFLAAPFGQSLHAVLAPGAAVLAKWLPVFFVPSLITLPLADGLGSASEVLKVASVIFGGFLFSLLTTSMSVLAVRRIFHGSAEESLPASDSEETTPVASSENAEKAPPKPFSDALNSNLQLATVISLCALLVSKWTTSTALDLIKTFFLLFATLASFVRGARFPKRITKIVHPLVTCTTATWLMAQAVGICTNQPFLGILSTYKSRTSPLLLNFLGPSVVSLACQMYDRRKLMQENLMEVATAILVSSVGGLFGTAALVRCLQIGNPLVRLSLLSRNITSPLAMAIASILGADVSLAVSMVVVTGLIGANFGASLLDAVGIKDAVARGLGIGAAAHGLGTAAFANEKDAFPFAAIAMALTASSCTVLVALPAIRRVVLRLALGW